MDDSELRIAMREVDGDTPNEMYEQAQKALKKYFGNSAITNAQNYSARAVTVVSTPVVKQEPFFSSMEEYETYAAWKQYRSKPNYRQSFNKDSSRPSNSDNNRSQSSRTKLLHRNPLNSDGKPMTCHVC